MNILAGTREQHISDYRRQIDRASRLAAAASAFLLRAHPDVKVETITGLCAAWVDWQTGELQDRIAFLETQATDEEYRPTPETLIKLIEARDRITYQLEKMATAQEKMEETVPGLSEMMEATAMPMLRTQLEMIEGEISFVQKQLEAQQPAPAAAQEEKPNAPQS